jgi:hypothetical protein
MSAKVGEQQAVEGVGKRVGSTAEPRRGTSSPTKKKGMAL